MQTKLIIECFNQKMKLLERREQWSRSFLQRFLEMLYVSHYQLQIAAALSMIHVDKESLPVDVQSGDNTYQVGHGKIGSPPGFSTFLGEYNMGGGAYGSFASLLGCDIGIQVGTDNTAVTPVDQRLGRRIGHGRRAPDGAAVIFEQYTTGDDGQESIYTTNWRAQEFMPQVDHRCSSVLVKIFKTGAPGDLTVELRAFRASTGGGGYSWEIPGTVVLATGTIAEAAIPGASPGAFVECTFVTPVDLYAGHIYFIVLHCGGSGANYVSWRKDSGGVAYERAINFTGTQSSRQHWSSDAGASWSITNDNCYLFQEKGQSQGEFEYGGCELSNLSFADPNGSFTIRRYFGNYCGSSLTVQEVGVTAVGIYHQGWASRKVAPFLIARDVVAPGLAVNNNELLRVTYVPQITV